MEFTVAFLFCQSQNKFHFTVTQKMHNYMLQQVLFFPLCFADFNTEHVLPNLQVFFFLKFILKIITKMRRKQKCLTQINRKKPFPPFNIYFFFFGKLFSLETLTASPFLKYYLYRQENMLCFFSFFCYTMYINSYAARILLPLTHQPTKYRYTPAYIIKRERKE